MKKIIFLICLSFFFNVIIAQSNISKSKNIYLLKLSVHHPDLKADKKKLAAAKKEITENILRDDKFILSLPFDENQVLIVSPNSTLIDGSVFQKFYDIYEIKVNIMNIREIENFDLSTLPIFNKEVKDFYLQQIYQWTTDNTKITAELKALF